MIKTCKFIFILLFTISVNITNIYNINATQEDEKHFHFMFQDGFHHSSNIFLGFEQSSFMFDTPVAHSILKWNDMQGFQTGFEFYAGYSKIRGYFKYTFSQLKGTGTDDDIANSGINGFAAFSTHNAKGSTHDLRFGIEGDIFKDTTSVVSLRTGYMYKKLNNWEMQTGGNQVYVDDSDAGFTNGLDAFNRTNTKIHAMTIGLKVTKSFNKNVVGTLIFDFYPVVRYIGNQNWSDVNHWGLRNNGYSNNYGFNIRPEVDFQINKNLFAKLYAYYEMIAINKLNELPSEPFDKVIKGKMMYHSFGLGLAIGFSGV